MVVVESVESTAERQSNPRLHVGIYVEGEWQDQALCQSGGALLELFFSEKVDDINAAKAFCGSCAVRAECLDAAAARREPWGVWGGELFINGKIIAEKPKRGRPPKNPQPVETVL